MPALQCTGAMPFHWSNGPPQQTRACCPGHARQVDLPQVPLAHAFPSGHPPSPPPVACQRRASPVGFQHPCTKTRTHTHTAHTPTRAPARSQSQPEWPSPSSCPPAPLPPGQRHSPESRGYRGHHSRSPQPALRTACYLPKTLPLASAGTYTASFEVRWPLAKAAAFGSNSEGRWAGTYTASSEGRRHLYSQP